MRVTLAFSLALTGEINFLFASDASLILSLSFPPCFWWQSTGINRFQRRKCSCDRFSVKMTIVVVIAFFLWIFLVNDFSVHSQKYSVSRKEGTISTPCRAAIYHKFPCQTLRLALGPEAWAKGPLFSQRICAFTRFCFVFCNFVCHSTALHCHFLRCVCLNRWEHAHISLEFEQTFIPCEWKEECCVPCSLLASVKKTVAWKV